MEDFSEEAIVRRRALPECTIIIHANEPFQKFTPVVKPLGGFFSVGINGVCSILLSTERLMELRDCIQSAVVEHHGKQEAA